MEFLKPYILAFFSAWCIVSDAQVSFTKNINAGNNYMYRNSASTPDGGFAMITEHGVISHELKPTYNLAKFDNEGNVEWEKEFTVPAYVNIKCISSWGSSISVAGMYSDNPSSGLNNVYCADIDLQGNLLWANVYKQTRNQFIYPLYFLKTLTNGDHIMNFYLYDAPNIQNGGNHICILKTDKNGNVIWGGSSSLLEGIWTMMEVNDNGDIFLKGGTTIAFINKSGALQWWKNMPELQNALKPEFIEDGKIVFASTLRANNQFYLQCINNIGDTVWTTPFLNGSGQTLHKRKGKPLLVAYNDGKNYMILEISNSGTILSTHAYPDLDIAVGEFHEACDGGLFLLGNSTNKMLLVKLTPDLKLYCADTNISIGYDAIVTTAPKATSPGVALILQNFSIIPKAVLSKQITLNTLLVCNNFPCSPIDLGNDTILCGKFRSTFKVQVKDNRYCGKSVKYLWSTGETTETIVVNKSGKYWLKVDYFNCLVSDTINIVFDDSQLDLGPDKLICSFKNENLTFDAGTFSSYTWWPNGETTKSITIYKPDSYAVSVTTNSGCFLYDNIIVRNSCPPILHVPNTFSPDANLLNDNFLPVGEFIDKYSLKIYNRWGELLYESVKLNEGWDGTLNGKPCPIGVYIYSISYKGGLQSKSISGSLQLIR